MSERATAPAPRLQEYVQSTSAGVEAQGCSISRQKLCVTPNFSPGQSPSDTVLADPTVASALVNDSGRDKPLGRHDSIAYGNPDQDFETAGERHSYLQRFWDLQQSMRLGESTVGAAVMVALGAAAVRFAAAATPALLENALVTTIATELAIFGTGHFLSAAVANFRLWAQTAWHANGRLREIELAQRYFDAMCAELTPAGLYATQSLWRRWVFGRRPVDENVIEAQWRWADEAAATSGSGPTVPARTESSLPANRTPRALSWWNSSNWPAPKQIVPFLPGGTGMLTQLFHAAAGSPWARGVQPPASDAPEVGPPPATTGFGSVESDLWEIKRRVEDTEWTTLDASERLTKSEEVIERAASILSSNGYEVDKVLLEGTWALKLTKLTGRAGTFYRRLTRQYPEMLPDLHYHPIAVQTETEGGGAYYRGTDNSIGLGTGILALTDGGSVQALKHELRHARHNIG